MAEKSSKTTSRGLEQSIEELQKRYQKLRDQQIRVETQRDATKQRLESLRQQAQEKYGTSDLAELQKKLDEIVAENARKRSKYQDDLDKIEQNLADVEKAFGDSANASPNTGPSRR